MASDQPLLSILSDEHPLLSLTTSSEMWPPPNFQSLPSKDEIQKAKEEISTIKLEIIEAELRLDALRTSLAERTAWIAPIRTIPHEILSLIFIEVSTTDWKAPLVLQSVCQRWRDVVADSPEAWTFITPSKYSAAGRSELISLFLERSRNAPLHISIGSDGLLGYMELLASRIKSFYVSTDRVLLNGYLQHGHTFHRLERLTIRYWHSPGDAPAADGSSPWDMSLFPNLKFLDLKCPSSSLLRAMSVAPAFPAIRHLRIDWMPERLPDILTKYAVSLESVDLFYDTRHFKGLHMEHEIQFPHLRYLRVEDRSDGEEPRLRIKAATPNLQAYIHDDEDISTLQDVKVDTGNVIFLHVFHTPDLSRYPRLGTLCFRGESCNEEEVIKATKCLRNDPTFCTDLALIEYLGKMTQENLVTAKDALLARERSTGQKIQLVEGTVETRQERVQTFKRLEPVCFLIIFMSLLPITRVRTYAMRIIISRGF